VPGNSHAPCGAGEKLEITSNAYLLQPIAEEFATRAALFLFVKRAVFCNKGVCYLVEKRYNERRK
jgi:hypothetical protein